MIFPITVAYIGGLIAGFIVGRHTGAGHAQIRVMLAKIENLTARLKQSSDRLRNAVADETKQ